MRRAAVDTQFTCYSYLRARLMAATTHTDLPGLTPNRNQPKPVAARYQFADPGGMTGLVGLERGLVRTVLPRDCYVIAFAASGNRTRDITATGRRADH